MEPLGPRPALWLPEGRSVRLPIRGVSMLPTLREGDFVEIRRATPSDLFPGAVLAFPRGEELVVHRLLVWEETRFLEMGDGQERGNWHAWPEVFGLAIAIERASGEQALWDTPEAKGRAARLATQMRRRHRAVVFGNALPGNLLKRIALRLLRPWIAQSAVNR